jgi:hypothetical protein
MVLGLAQGRRWWEDCQRIMKPEDFFQPRIEKVDSEILRSCSTLISLELARRVQEGQPEAAGCLIEAAKHATDAFFDLFVMEPYRFRPVLKERTNCPVPMPANKYAREKVLQFMSENTTFKTKQEWSIDIYNPVHAALIRQIHGIQHIRSLWVAREAVGFTLILNAFEQQCVDLPDLCNDKEVYLQWFRVIWRNILRETDNKPHEHDRYDQFAPKDGSGLTKEDLQRKLRTYFIRLLPKRA